MILEQRKKALENKMSTCDKMIQDILHHIELANNLYDPKALVDALKTIRIARRKANDDWVVVTETINANNKALQDAKRRGICGTKYKAKVIKTLWYN